MIVYHGSCCIVNEPRIINENRALDFGFGFYTTSNFDIVIGPVADDQVYKVIVQFENGYIDKNEALKRLKTEKLCDQILFHTNKALRYLHYICSEET